MAVREDTGIDHSSSDGLKLYLAFSSGARRVSDCESIRPPEIDVQLR
jgi:hypothetical protein